MQSESSEGRDTQTGFDGIGSRLHIANMKELILSPCWLGGKQILRPEFECDLQAPRLPHVAQVQLGASLKAAYENQLAQARTARKCVRVCVFVVEVNDDGFISH